MTVAYNPSNRFEIKVWDTEFRRTPARQLMARVYQPQGDGPFPTLLDLHGGAWNNQDRTANAPMDESLARSGILVVAIDLTRAPEAPYPASVQDANYGVRWFKAKARNVDATLAYVVARSPVSDPYARFQQAERRQWTEMIQNSKTYFNPWESIHEGNPQKILERGEKVSLPPMYILQGELDDNVLPAVQEKFAATYKAAGGECEFEVFQGAEHRWVAKPSPQTERAYVQIKAFIAKQLRAKKLAA